MNKLWKLLGVKPTILNIVNIDIHGSPVRIVVDSEKINFEKEDEDKIQNSIN